MGRPALDEARNPAELKPGHFRDRVQGIRGDKLLRARQRQVKVAGRQVVAGRLREAERAVVGDGLALRRLDAT